MTSCLDFLGRKSRPKNGGATKPGCYPHEQQPSGRVFGCDLNEHLVECGRKVPFVVEWATRYVLQACRNCELVSPSSEGVSGPARNIYRVPGSKTEVDSLKLVFENVHNEASEKALEQLLDNEGFQGGVKQTRVNSVASLLKSYFSSLPQPLIQRETQAVFVEAAGSQPWTTEKVDKIMDDHMSPEAKNCLKILVCHLKAISQLPDSMSVQSLATVWAPNLFHSQSPNEVIQHIRVIEMLILTAKDMPRPVSAMSSPLKVLSPVENGGPSFDHERRQRRLRRSRIHTSLRVPADEELQPKTSDTTVSTLPMEDHELTSHLVVPGSVWRDVDSHTHSQRTTASHRRRSNSQKLRGAHVASAVTPSGGPVTASQLRNNWQLVNAKSTVLAYSHSFNGTSNSPKPVRTSSQTRPTRFLRIVIK